MTGVEIVQMVERATHDAGPPQPGKPYPLVAGGITTWVDEATYVNARVAELKRQGAR